MNTQQPNSSPLDAPMASPPRVSRQPPSVSQTKSAGSALTDSRWMVLAILFGVTGALGIPLLWVNKRFNTGERIFWSLVVTLYTTALVGITAAILMWSYRMITGW